MLEQGVAIGAAEMRDAGNSANPLALLRQRKAGGFLAPAHPEGSRPRLPSEARQREAAASHPDQSWWIEWVLTWGCAPDRGWEWPTNT